MTNEGRNEAGMTAGELVSTLFDRAARDRGDVPYHEALLQATFDGERFFVVASLDEYSDGGVVLQLAPWPSVSPVGRTA